MSRMMFSFSERDGLTYVNPLPACHSARRWRDVLAKIGRYIDRISCLRQRGLHGQIPGSR